MSFEEDIKCICGGEIFQGAVSGNKSVTCQECGLEIGGCFQRYQILDQFSEIVERFKQQKSDSEKVCRERYENLERHVACQDDEIASLRATIEEMERGH